MAISTHRSRYTWTLAAAMIAGGGGMQPAQAQGLSFEQRNYSGRYVDQRVHTMPAWSRTHSEQEARGSIQSNLDLVTGRKADARRYHRIREVTDFAATETRVSSPQRRSRSVSTYSGRRTDSSRRILVSTQAGQG